MVPGTQVGAYRILEQIGEGGMGAVFLAEHTMLGRRAAIKVLHAQYSAQTAIVTRFFNEAKAATAISDPGIVQIFDFGTNVDGSAYIVMELLDGESLHARLRRVRAMSLPDTLRVMQQIATSLGAAHARGIVHRDLKPENIFLVRDPAVPGGERAKILDFGIAKLVGDQGVKTNTHAVMGTPTFMSPEQCRGAGGVDQRSDVYSLGCVMYMLLTGHPVFDAEGIGDIIAMHLREAPPIPSARVPALPPEIDQLIACCLAKSPAQRFHDGTALANKLAELSAMFAARSVQPGTLPPASYTAPGGAVRAAPTPAPLVSPSTPTTLTSASVGVSPPPQESRRALFAVLGLAVFVVAGGAAWVVVKGRRTSSPAATAAQAPSGGSQAPAQPAPAAAPIPAPTPTPTPGPSVPADPATKFAAMASAAFATFNAWAKDHAGAPCPDAATLHLAPDPWGTPLAVTCTGQPSDQIIGLTSAGPDAKAGTDDDIASWTLGRDVVNAVRGARWKTVVTHKTPSQPTTTPVVKPKPKFVDLDGDGIPDSR